VPVSLPVVAWAITGSLKTKTIVISVSAPKSVNNFAMNELLIFCLLKKIQM
jgi:hypothetical protein